MSRDLVADGDYEELMVCFGRWLQSLTGNDRRRIFREVVEPSFKDRLREMADYWGDDQVAHFRDAYIKRAVDRTEETLAYVFDVYDSSRLNGRDQFRQRIAKAKVVVFVRMVFDNLPGAMRNEIMTLFQQLGDLNNLDLYQSEQEGRTP